MCQSKANGGKRCAYAAKLDAVRKKVRRAHKGKDGSSVEKEVITAVRQWQEKNPQEVLASLPKKQQFQVAGGKKAVPEHIKSLLTPLGEPVRGASEQDRIQRTREMFNEHEEWMNQLTDEERDAVYYYVSMGYEPVNRIARGRGYTAWLREHRFLDSADHIRDYAQRSIDSLDHAFSKSPDGAEARRLYRFFRVPAGVSTQEYVKRYMVEGSGFRDKGFLSTTEDPEFLMTHIDHRNKGKGTKGYIVMEIVSRQGLSLQPEPESSHMDVQSLEREVLLPRQTKLRIVESRPNQSFVFGSNREDLTKKYGASRGRRYKEGDRMNFHLVQMVDEDLITNADEA